MLNAIKSLSCLLCKGGQGNTNKNGASDVIALDPRPSALASLDSRELLGLSMKLLNFPAQGTRLLRTLRQILRKVVRDDQVRAVGRHLNAEQFYLTLFGEISDLDDLSVRRFALIPTELIDMPVRQRTARIVDQTIAF